MRLVTQTHVTAEVFVGIDAHDAEALNRPQSIQEAEDIARRYGLSLRETVELRPPV